MKNWWWLLAGLGAAAAVAQVASWRRKQSFAPGVDLNACDREDLLQLPGMNNDLADRILENRPYRSKYDLLNRFVISDAAYARIRSLVRVDEAGARRSVQVAS